VIFGWYGTGRGQVAGTVANLAAYVDDCIVDLGRRYGDPHPLAKALREWTDDIARLKDRGSKYARAAAVASGSIVPAPGSFCRGQEIPILSRFRKSIATPSELLSSAINRSGASADMDSARNAFRRVGIIELRNNGRLIGRFQRLKENDTVILSDGDSKNDRLWHIVRGEFLGTAAELRDKHARRIEPKRSAEVALAIPEDTLNGGLLCACLPTEQDEALPFHLNADFFTTNDRKRVILASDYQSEWNREAIVAASRALSEALKSLPRLLGGRRFWQLAASLKAVADKAEEGRADQTLAEFWNQIAPQLRGAAVIQTTTNKWVSPSESCLLLQREEGAAAPVLSAIGLNVAHEDLRPFQTLLRSELEVSLVNIGKIAKALAALGLDRRIEMRELPAGLRAASYRDMLWGEITLLLERQQRTLRARAEDERRLHPIALAPGRDGALWPCEQAYSADEATISLIEPLNLGITFVAQERAFEPLEHL
jgi:hypothetical protein